MVFGKDNMPRFFVKKDNVSDSKVIITDADIKHIVNVLRKGIGDILEVSDGEGNKYTVKITSISKDQIIADILEKQVECSSKINVTLYQSLPKAGKMDLIIQKCTELGVEKIVPFISKRTVVNIDNKAQDKKVQRWRKIAVEACKQCNRTTIPNISTIYTLEEVLREINTYDLSLLAYEKEKSSMKQILKENRDSRNIAIIVGPEGGFEESEVKRLTDKGVRSITLGPRILRTETAGMAMLCIVMYEFGCLE